MLYTLKFFLILTIALVSVDFLSRPAAPLTHISEKRLHLSRKKHRYRQHSQQLVSDEAKHPRSDLTHLDIQREDSDDFRLTSPSSRQLSNSKFKGTLLFNSLPRKKRFIDQTRDTAQSNHDILEDTNTSDYLKDDKGESSQAKKKYVRRDQLLKATEWRRRKKSSLDQTNQHSKLSHRLLKRGEHSHINSGYIQKSQHAGHNADIGSQVLALASDSSVDDVNRSVRSAAPSWLHEHNSSCFFNDTFVNCTLRGLNTVPTDLFPATVTVYLLSCNDFMNIEDFAFSRYTALQLLDLSHNHLLSLHNDSFAGLKNLLHLNLDSSILGSMSSMYPENVFAPLVSLEILWLTSTNSMEKYPDRALSKLRNLNELHINGLQSADFGPGFRNLTKLHTLSLSGSEGLCYLQSLKNTTFVNVPSVRNLSLDKCQISGKSVEAGAFSPLTKLAYLNMNNNRDIGYEHLNNIFYGLHKTATLKTLLINNIMNYHITSLCLDSKYISYFPQYLEKLDVGYNALEGVDRDVIDKLSPTLEILDISANAFAFGTYLKDLSKMKNLTKLLYNGCSDVDRCIPGLPYIFPSKQRSKAMEHFNCSLYETSPYDEPDIGEIIIKIPPRLKHVEMNNIGFVLKLTQLNIDDDNELETLSMSGNVFPELTGTILGLSKLKSLILRSNKAKYISHRFLVSMESVEMLDLSSNLFPTVYDAKYKKPIFTAMRDLRFLNLSCNEITILHEHTFDGLYKLKGLDLSSNRLTEYLVNISHMSRLEMLNLSHNGLTSLPENTFHYLFSLKVLNLRHNRLEKFVVDMSRVLTLEILDLSYNLVTLLPSKVTKYVDHLQSLHGNFTIHLAGFRVPCNCDNLEFLRWLSQSKLDLPNAKDYKCMYPDNSYRDVTDRYKSTFTALSRECVSNYAIFLVSGATTLFLICIIIGGIAYRFRWNLRYFYYAAYLRYKKAGANRDADYEFDVFISYAEEDVRFVIDTMSPELENRGVKMLIHGRDFVAGEYIASNIVKAVCSSRKTLVVLTRDMMNSYWCGYEVQMANMESVQRGGKVLIFLLMEKIPESELGVELLYNIRNNTYIPYPDTLPDDRNMGRLWDKLVADIKN